MRTCFLLIIIFSGSLLYAQDSTLTYDASIFASGSTRQTPFLAQANQNGTIPALGSFASGRFGLYKIYNPSDPRFFQWTAGAELITNYSKSGQIFFSDLFVGAKLGIFQIAAGQKKNVSGLMDTTLTSGSLSFSGNARPFPRLELSIPEFYPLPFTNYVLAVKASYSDGLLAGTDINYGSIRHIPKTYFHQKSLYLRLGDTNGKLLGFMGINHQAIWGGEEEISPLYKMSPKDAYWHTVTGKTFEQKKIGNHFGTIDLGLRWRGKKWSYYAYRQNIYESGSLFKVINFTDGLNGLSVKSNQLRPPGSTYFAIHSLLLEILGTKDQSNKNPLSGIALFEQGNYFNHYVYSNGWSYLGRNMGTPLIANKNSITGDGYSASEFTNNNRLWAFHAGMTASWLNVNFLFKGTYSRNFGTYISPFEQRRDQVSALLSAEKKLPFKLGITGFASIATDVGSVYRNSTSLLVGIRKRGFLN